MKVATAERIFISSSSYEFIRLSSSIENYEREDSSNRERPANENDFR